MGLQLLHLSLSSISYLSVLNLPFFSSISKLSITPVYVPNTSSDFYDQELYNKNMYMTSYWLQ